MLWSICAFCVVAYVLFVNWFYEDYRGHLQGTEPEESTLDECAAHVGSVARDAL